MHFSPAIKGHSKSHQILIIPTVVKPTDEENPSSFQILRPFFDLFIPVASG